MTPNYLILSPTTFHAITFATWVRLGCLLASPLYTSSYKRRPKRFPTINGSVIHYGFEVAIPRSCGRGCGSVRKGKPLEKANIVRNDLPSLASTNDATMRNDWFDEPTKKGPFRSSTNVRIIITPEFAPDV
ncbi:hypothetical protein F5X97DRAFT_307414 [Nemania serpens]|nr:hypothetical protein F5X97DRAFT_307414 [Nemania serpens]